jgi:hypothetical protein
MLWKNADLDPYPMRTTDDRTFIEDVLANGLDDWVYAGWVYQIARRSGLEDPMQLRWLSVALITDVLTRGLMVAGEYDGEKHAPWDCSTGAAIERISEAWSAWGDSAPTPGAIVWLDLTPAGRQLAEEIVAREPS